MARITGYTVEGTNARIQESLDSALTGLSLTALGGVSNTDFRLTDMRTPRPHHSSHYKGASDRIHVEELATRELTADRILVTQGDGGVTWATKTGVDQVHCAVWLSTANVSITSQTLTKLILNTVETSSHVGMLVGNAIDIPLGQSGVYAMIGQIRWSSTIGPTGDVSAQLHTDSGGLLAETRALGRASMVTQVSTLAPLVAGDRVSLHAWHSIPTPGAYAVVGGLASSTFLKLWRIA